MAANSFEFKGDPVGKPRMTQRDRWAKRPSTQKYWAFKDALKSQSESQKFKPGNALKLIFYIQMPKSWSKKKKKEKNGTPHDQKPDIDNLSKAFMDCLLEEDKCVWLLEARKYWVEDNPGIVAINIK